MNIQRSMLACAAALAASMSAAYAGPCSPEITQVQEQIDASMQAKARGVTTLPESTAGRLCEGGLRYFCDGEHWRLPMRTIALLVFAMAFSFATAAMADPHWKPCDYYADWKIYGTSCVVVLVTTKQTTHHRESTNSCGPHAHLIRAVCQPDNTDHSVRRQDPNWRPCDQSIVLGPASCE